MKTNFGLVAYCKAQLGKPYWYGTFGQTSSMELWAQKRQQYPSFYKDDDYSKQLNQRVHDCIGLIKGYLWSDTPSSASRYNADQDVSAPQMLLKCTERGEIRTMPEIPGVLVFMSGHVGVYIGGGEVIEARGHVYGVVKTKLKNRPWQNWGKCPWITYTSGSSGATKSKETEVKKVSLTFNELHTGSSGIQVTTVQRLLKSMGYKGADGKTALVLDGVFGKNTAAAVRNFQKQNRLEPDSIVGVKTWAKLTGGEPK